MRRLPLLLLLALGACKEKAPVQDTATTAGSAYSVPKAGTVVAADSMDVSDALNEMYFAVRIVAGAHSFRRTYDVFAHFGPNEGETQITFPKADVTLRPVLRRGSGNHTYIIGFLHGQDTTFYEYFMIRGGKKEMEMKYLKAYSFK
ncbi:MAG: hypothetical protein EOP49_06965 [Sphingobacteriales bacterium]|nr:MAG: hypothetical protein EOP49_06965 [Sphingobacteriales bacterium]